MKKYKSLVSALLCAAMLFVGCNHNPATPDDPADDPTNTNQPTEQTTSTFTVTFDSQGGSEVAAQSVESGKTATAPEDPTSEGLYFAGWYTDEECTTLFEFTTPITESITLYAKWSTDPVYTITVKYNDGATADGSYKATKDGEYKIAAPSTAKAGYTVKWYSDEACKTEVDFTKAFEANATIYAKYTIITYTITYSLSDSDATNSSSNPSTYTVESEITLSDPTASTGKIFCGWYKESTYTTKITKIEKGTTGNLTLYGRLPNIAIESNSFDLGTQYNAGHTISAEVFADITTDDTIIIMGTIGTESYHQLQLCANTTGWPVLADIAEKYGNDYQCIPFSGSFKFSFSTEELKLVKEYGMAVNGYDVIVSLIKIYKEKTPVVLAPTSGDTYGQCQGRGITELDNFTDDALYTITFVAEDSITTPAGDGIAHLVYWDDWDGTMEEINSLNFNANNELLTAKEAVYSVSVKTIKDALSDTGKVVVGYGWCFYNQVSIKSISVIEIY